MSAAEALEVARSARLELRVDGQGLVLKASVPHSPTVLDLLVRNKAGVVAILRTEVEDWPADEWRVLFDERAAIAEFDGGLSRQAAEALARACCVAEWLNRHSVRASPEKCLLCGQADYYHEPLLPCGTEAEGHAWLHHRCWEDWHARRKTEATDALATMGITIRSSTT
ncbi:hypothetical protein [Jannaschia seohaensis]|uniref:TubC N-terminal docking domain-containing protein n=1 Tax=Jannaschia seohaensis TaxID=475081 RepID=A0A2Y9B1D7_9RHOB|nr:hypothetical protein [Jannaschia seohaensis]PWJ13801.1 hypothetical protein BCF38_11332 [Jannaschia seohaensis]SSA50314.1 hypothetical protein SAMN05421539_11332 [Jannaschia seohaensis]